METVKYLNLLTLIKVKCRVVLKTAKAFKRITLTMDFFIRDSTIMTSSKETDTSKPKIDKDKDTSTKVYSRTELQMVPAFQTSLKFRFQLTKNRNRIKKKLKN